jgi:hypothetical protein
VLQDKLVVVVLQELMPRLLNLRRRESGREREEEEEKKVLCELGRENERGKRKKDRIIVKVTTINFNELSHMKVHYSIFW